MLTWQSDAEAILPSDEACAWGMACSESRLALVADINFFAPINRHLCEYPLWSKPS